MSTAYIDQRTLGFRAHTAPAFAAPEVIAQAPAGGLLGGVAPSLKETVAEVLAGSAVALLLLAAARHLPQIVATVLGVVASVVVQPWLIDRLLVHL